MGTALLSVLEKPLGGGRGHHLADGRPHDFLDLLPRNGEVDNVGELSGALRDLWCVTDKSRLLRSIVGRAFRQVTVFRDSAQIA